MGYRSLVAFLLFFTFISYEIQSQVGVRVVRCITIDRCEDGDSEVDCKLNSRDPCDCGNQDNTITIGGEVLLADTLCITAKEGLPPLDEGEYVFIDLTMLPSGFLDSDGVDLVQKAIDEFNQEVAEYNMNNDPDRPSYCNEPLVDPINTNCSGIEDFLEIGPANEDGEIKIPFWRHFGETLVIDLNPDAVSDNSHHFEFPCEVTSCPPIFEKKFDPPAFVENHLGEVIFTINRDVWPANITQIAFTEVLPEGVSIFPGSTYTSTCIGGTVDLDFETNSISYMGGMLPDDMEECSITVSVTGVPGSYMNDPVMLSTIIGDNSSEPAPLEISRAIPTLSEWALIILGILLMIFGVLALKQSRLVVKTPENLN